MKLKRASVLLALFLMLALLVSACSDQGESPSVPDETSSSPTATSPEQEKPSSEDAGTTLSMEQFADTTWDLVGGLAYGVELSLEEIADEGNNTLTFKADGTLLIAVSDMIYEGVYEIIDGELRLTDDTGVAQVATLDGDVMTLRYYDDEELALFYTEV